MAVGWGLRLDILLPHPQCSHVVEICHAILSCSPQELLEQTAVLERVQLDDPLVSADPLAALSGSSDLAMASHGTLYCYGWKAFSVQLLKKAQRTFLGTHCHSALSPVLRGFSWYGLR